MIGERSEQGSTDAEAKTDVDLGSVWNSIKTRVQTDFTATHLEGAPMAGPNIQGARRATNLKASITRRFRFEAAHRLPHHDGKCRRLHGHSYILDVTVRGKVVLSEKMLMGGEPSVPIGATGTSDHGMVYDFANLDALVTEHIVGVWDHTDLNASVSVYPTAELLAHRAWDIVESKLPPGIEVTHVRLYETERGWVDLAPEDRY